MPVMFLEDSLHAASQSAWDNRLIYTRLRKVNQQLTTQGIAIRYVLQGEEQYRMDGRTFAVRAGDYLVINDGRHMACRVDSEHTVEGISIYLSRRLLHETLASLDLAPADKQQARELLDADELCEQVYDSQDNHLGMFLCALGERLRRQQVSREESNDIASEAAALLLHTQVQVFRNLNRINSAKLSTRKELYWRLCQARTFIHENLDAPLDLDTLAQVACLSKFHFIRLFKEVYGQTPRQYLIARRLDRASKLLIHSRMTFHEICTEVGLKDSSSFGRLFKRSYGATPQLYRQQHVQA
ncbi:MAG: hypothetical protein OHK0039_45450 [Bacteroidia bacterium]